MTEVALLELLTRNPVYAVILIAWPGVCIWILQRLMKQAEQREDQLTQQAERREERLIQVNDRWADVNEKWADAVNNMTSKIEGCNRRN